MSLAKQVLRRATAGRRGHDILIVLRQGPIHWDGMATLGRTNDAHRPHASRATAHLDFISGNNLAATEAVTLVIQRIPFPELIESLQHLQFIGVR